MTMQKRGKAVAHHIQKAGRIQKRASDCGNTEEQFHAVLDNAAQPSRFRGDTLRTLLDLHLGHTLSLTSCLGFVGIEYSCPQ
jgi:hypothetical protein